MARVLRHRAGEGGEFTRQYRVHRLVYAESFGDVENAIARETEINKWRREKNVEKIERENPNREDFAAGWGERAGMRVGEREIPQPRSFGPVRNDNNFSRVI